MEIPEEIRNAYRKQGYALIGKYGAVKICHWTKKAIKGEGICYKQKFYNIKSHRCVQMTPALYFCTHKCVFCWRAIEYSLGYQKVDDWDDPKEIVKLSIEAQRKLLSGYKGHEKVKEEILNEALNPKHVAISLAGEPTLYQPLGELIREYHKAGFTTFLVTNGTQPEMLERLIDENSLPTQLYITVTGFSQEIYKRTSRPIIKDGWERLNRSLSLIPEMKKRTRTVVRLTLVRKFNFLEPEKYGKFLSNFEPHFIEAKSFVSVGFARERGLTEEYTITHEEILEFSRKLAEAMGYKVIDDKKESRVALIAKEDYSWRLLKD